MVPDVDPVNHVVGPVPPGRTVRTTPLSAGHLRAATTNDAEHIAGLHADSWRRNYRGAYPDGFLDDEVFEDRQVTWRARLTRPGANDRTVVADLDGEVVGFVHTVLDDDPIWGALLDNLHVMHSMKRRGLGARLVAECARLVVEPAPSASLYLWVLEQNTNAQAFYGTMGGLCVERQRRDPLPGYRLRYAWDDLAHLLIPGDAQQSPTRL